MFLFIDYETSGFPKKTGELKQVGQARACQVAMLLTDAAGKSMSEFSCMIKLDADVVINEGAAAVHGFTNELCAKYGVSPAAAYSFFCAMAAKSEVVIAFNSEFDRKMAEIEGAYCDKPFPETPWHCAMLEVSPICNLPPTPKMVAAGFIKNKPPSLKEAYKILCDKDIGDGAHDALWDVRALKDIFFKIKSMEKAA